MGKLKQKNEQLFSALSSLDESVIMFEKVKKKDLSFSSIDDDQLYRTFRDSMIQRFEFSTDLFWKYVKRYLEEESKQIVEINAPRPVIRSACKAKLISEQDSESILDMIDSRNQSSHIYKEEVADRIGTKIGKFYSLMLKYAKKLSP